VTQGQPAMTVIDDSISSRVNRSWHTAVRNLNNTFDSGLTFTSRWLYPFTKILRDNPNTEGMFIFLSDPSWFKGYLNDVDFSDCLKLYNNPAYRHPESGRIRIFFPQKLRAMRRVLGFKGYQTNKQLKESLGKLFRSRSFLKNLYAHWDEIAYTVPYTELDVFVKVDRVPKYPGLVQVSLGGIPRLSSSKLSMLATQLKFFHKKELNFHSDPFVNFYKELYLDRKVVFRPSELPWMLSWSGIFPEPILAGVVDINREHFLQETLLGKLMFFWYKFWNHKGSLITHLYSRADIPKLETKMNIRFPEFMRGIRNNDVSLEPDLL